MNDAERRRQELLEQTRALYNDRRTIPAVHPRYANAYHYLYGKSQEDINEDTKAGRTLITGEQLWKAQRTDDHKQKRSE